MHWPHRGQTSFFAVLACESTKNSPLPCYNLAPREDHDDGKMRKARFTTGAIGLLLLGLVHSLSLFAPTLRWQMRPAS